MGVGGCGDERAQNGRRVSLKSGIFLNFWNDRFVNFLVCYLKFTGCRIKRNVYFMYETNWH
jgi:hypothetical protein